MLPPRYPPRSPPKFEQKRRNSPPVPYPNNQRRNSTSRQKYRQSNDLHSLQSRSRVSRYEHLRTQQQKRKALGRKRYINQLAYLDYEEKYIEIHTKYTMASRLTAMKKIKAKNQMAQFIQQQQEEQLGFQELMDYKYGRQSNNGQFFFEKNELITQYQFCGECDTIHNDHHEVHQKICREKVLSSDEYDMRSHQYVLLSLQRIEQSLRRTSGQQYQTLKQLIRNVIEIEARPINRSSNRLQIGQSQLQKQLKNIYQIQKVNERDIILKGICEKIMKVLYKRSIK